MGGTFHDLAVTTSGVAVLDVCCCCCFCMALFRCSFLVALPAAFASAVVGGRGMTLVTLPTAFVRPSLNTRRCPTLNDLVITIWSLIVLEGLPSETLGA